MFDPFWVDFLLIAHRVLVDLGLIVDRFCFNMFCSSAVADTQLCCALDICIYLLHYPLSLHKYANTVAKPDLALFVWRLSLFSVGDLKNISFDPNEKWISIVFFSLLNIILK